MQVAGSSDCVTSAYDLSSFAVHRHVFGFSISIPRGLKPRGYLSQIRPSILFRKKSILLKRLREKVLLFMKRL